MAEAVLLDVNAMGVPEKQLWLTSRAGSSTNRKNKKLCRYFSANRMTLQGIDNVITNTGIKDYDR